MTIRQKQLKTKYDITWKEVQRTLPSSSTLMTGERRLDIQFYAKVLSMTLPIVSLVENHKVSWEQLEQMESIHQGYAIRPTHKLTAVYPYALLGMYVLTAPESIKQAFLQDPWIANFAARSKEYFEAIAFFEEFIYVKHGKSTSYEINKHERNLNYLSGYLGELPCLNRQIQAIFLSLMNISILNGNVESTIDRVRQEIEWLFSYYTRIVRNLTRYDYIRDAMLEVIDAVVPVKHITREQNSSSAIASPESQKQLANYQHKNLTVIPERAKFTGSIPLVINTELVFIKDDVSVSHFVANINTTIPYNGKPLSIVKTSIRSTADEVVNEVAEHIIATLDREFQQSEQGQLAAEMKRKQQILDSVKNKLSEEELSEFVKYIRMDTLDL